MANHLKIYLNVHEKIMKEVQEGKATQYVEVYVDAVKIGQMESTHEFEVDNGAHKMHLKYHYHDSASNFACYHDSDFTINDNDCEMTINVYALNHNKVDIVEGKEPFDIKQREGGCYVATCVYGSYDCPEVWTLRRYRDDTLASTWYGRAFIHTYYAVSPTLVRWFGDTDWFKQMWRGTLDRMVNGLREKGVEDTPYEDRDW